MGQAEYVVALLWMKKEVYSDTPICGGFVFLVVFLSFVALANDPGVGEDYSCPHILRYSATLLVTHQLSLATNKKHHHCQKINIFISGVAVKKWYFPEK